MSKQLLETGAQFTVEGYKGNLFVVERVRPSDHDYMNYTCRDLNEKVRTGQQGTIYGFADCNFTGPNGHKLTIQKPVPTVEEDYQNRGNADTPWPPPPKQTPMTGNEF